VEIAEALIDAGASINGLPEARGFPLEAAAWDGRADVVRLLLDRGATPDAAALESAEGNIGKFAPGYERRAGYEQTIALLKTALARP
jgi:ankyrin repeat protein